MRVVLFCHSLISDWNHGNAHFLRGVTSELQARGHSVTIFEPHNSWSLQNLIADHGAQTIHLFHEAYPHLRSVRYGDDLDLDRALDGADLVIVHEWNQPSLVEQIGNHRTRNGRYRLLFHDTHHRSVTDPDAMQRYNLDDYDGVLAFGNSVAERYRANGWGKRVWTWHEAADARRFFPREGGEPDGDLIWIGNWGDDERTAELQEFLMDPVRDLGLNARVHGVRYPPEGILALAQAGIEYAGWIANFEAPYAYSKFKVTLHIPRRPYLMALRGVPTIRVFEALACGIPLICAPWDDAENLFEPGADYLMARNGAEMTSLLRELLADRQFAAGLASHGRKTILNHHTCANRVDELIGIFQEMEQEPAAMPAAAVPIA